MTNAFRVLPLALLSLAAAQQPQRPVFRSAVDLVAVEVQVVDAGGVPIQTLGLKDFEVKIDGRRRPVVSLDLVNYDPAVRAAMPRPVTDSAPNSGPSTRDRMFILAFDEASFRPGDAMVAARAARKFIDTLHPSDYIGLYKFPVVSRQLDLTHGHAAVKVALDNVMGGFSRIQGEFNLLPSEVVDINANDTNAWQEVVRRECHEDDVDCPDRIVQEARMVAAYAEGDASTRVHALRVLLGSLAHVSGRKTLVILSGGMFAADRTGGRPEISASMLQVGKEAAIANTNLYVLHLDTGFMNEITAPSRGAVAAGDMPLVAKSLRDESLNALGLERLAGAAGGGYIAIRAGTPDYAFARVVREAAAYYLLGVEPEERDRDGRLHYLRVSARAKHATVRGRTHVVIPRRR